MVPSHLPLHVSDDQRKMTVEEYFGLVDSDHRDTP